MAKMPRFIPPDKYHITKVDGKNRRALSKDAFGAFNLAVLGLGDVSAPAKPTDAIAGVFDLESFTNFCKQIEPHLAVPAYLHAFLTWLMSELRDEMRDKQHGNDIILWCPLPFFVKFLGDGLLVLWDCAEMTDVTQRNVVISCRQICIDYTEDFVPTLKGKLVDPPTNLRCGVARGTVFSVGEGQDYVGSCINLAGRLQKLPGISFSFNRRGFNLDDPMQVKFFSDDITIKQVSIRGIGDHELIGVLKKELQQLSPKDRKFYKDV
jgi:class 3 adenylate cyclase